MSVSELKMKLVGEGFNPDSYSIEGPMPSYEGLILEKKGPTWEIDHFERGMRRQLETFLSEEEACDRMYEMMVKYFR